MNSLGLFLRVRQRGNIILTALFIAIFLFFLSVALIWTNRQDIALSLSMEHKLKAQSAARSGAYEAFARLREFGELQTYRGGKFPGGAEVSVSLVSQPARGFRGEKLLIRSRGTSGPLSSYMTLHLLESEIAGEKNKDHNRVLFLLKGAQGKDQNVDGSGSEEDDDQSDNQEGADQESESEAIYGDFIKTAAGAGILAGQKANGGPVFGTSTGPPVPPSFLGYIPVFGTTLMGWGPVFVVPPKTSEVGPFQETRLRHLKYTGSEFEWEEIKPPTELGAPDPDPASNKMVGVMQMESGGSWTHSTVQATVDSGAINYAWTDLEPPTKSVSEVPPPVFVGPKTELGPLIDWSSVPNTGIQEKFLTHGQIYAVKNAVYSHGWHYMYTPYGGQVRNPWTMLDGASLVRWPCILKYTIGGAWEKVWTPLQEDGSVTTEHRPDPSVLLVSQDGRTLYSVTETAPRRLLTMTGKSTKVGSDELPAGELILYQDKLYVIPQISEEFALKSVMDGQHIGFKSLPVGLPEISGEVVDTSGTGLIIINGPEGSYSGEVLDSTKHLAFTAQPEIRFYYKLLPVPVAVDGEDLWGLVSITTEELDPSNEKAYEGGEYKPAVALARYDGAQWHILPNGLRAILRNPSLGVSASGVLAAVYPGLPKQVSRYTIISVDTNPFGALDE